MAALTVVLAATSACGHKIGDSCGNSADCDPSGGGRTCDISQPGGYCIVEGCDARSCPSDSACVRFFPRPPVIDPSTPTCDPAAAATCSGGPAAGTCCEADEVCLPTPKEALDGVAVPGVCVRATLEKRACVQSCGSNGDCRGGYVCRSTGTCGTIALVLDPNAVPKYCAPSPDPSDVSCVP